MIFSFCLFASFLPKYKKNQNVINFRLFWFISSFPKFYLLVRFWNFEDNLHLMETFSGQNFNIFEICMKMNKRSIFHPYQLFLTHINTCEVKRVSKSLGHTLKKIIIKRHGSIPLLSDLSAIINLSVNW